MALNSNLKEILEEQDELYRDNMYKLFGYTLLGYPTQTDSSRQYMFSQHVKQYLTPLQPDIPRVQTGYENLFGKYSTGYKQISGKWKVLDKIVKYSSGPIYTLVMYNEETDTYTMIEKPVVESLTEKFGFAYNTEVMDTAEINDTLTEPVVYRSTSYDENMNYRYGKNAKIYFSTTPDTLEDALVISKSWADTVQTIEADTVTVMVNDNDVFLNIYGDDKNYKAFPEIGEKVKNSSICATRKIRYNTAFFDFTPKNMRQVHIEDTQYYVAENSVIYDMDIYFNGQNGFPDNMFSDQLRKYYLEQGAYVDRILEWLIKIEESGSNYTQEIQILKTRYQHFNDPEWKWKHKDKVFGHMLVEFHVMSVHGIEEASKITGRYGNKGVVSRITSPIRNIAKNIFDALAIETTPEMLDEVVMNAKIIDDEKMPYTDKFKVDILFNQSGSVRRLNPGQLFEVEINFIARCIQDKLSELKSLKEKEKLIFEFLEIVNPDQKNFYWELYNGETVATDFFGDEHQINDKKSKERFIESIETNGFYLVCPPDKPLMYNTFKLVYEKFPWIKPQDLYINIFGSMKRKIMHPGIVGDMYVIILKHNSSKNFSARSTYRVNRTNLPAKDPSKKNNKSSYSRSPIRLSEIYALLPSISGETLAEYNMYTRSSILGRKALGNILKSEGNPLKVKRLEIKEDFRNANADILNAQLKSVGIRLRYITEQDKNNTILEDAIMPLYIEGKVIYDTPLNKKYYIELINHYKNWIRKHNTDDMPDDVKYNNAIAYAINHPSVNNIGTPSQVIETFKDLYRFRGEPGKKKKIENHMAEDDIEEDEL